MRTVNPYLTFPGNCEEAFNFYKSVFGGEFAYVGRFSEMPPQEGMPPVSETDKNKIMHVSLPISKETNLMGCDDWGGKATYGDNIGLSISADSKEDADRLFQQLSSGGRTTMPMGDTFWGSYFGMCSDRFNISWMIGYDQPQTDQSNTSERMLETQDISA
jgi:PhnB protein